MVAMTSAQRAGARGGLSPRRLRLKQRTLYRAQQPPPKWSPPPLPLPARRAPDAPRAPPRRAPPTPRPRSAHAPPTPASPSRRLRPRDAVGLQPRGPSRLRGRQERTAVPLRSDLGALAPSRLPEAGGGGYGSSPCSCCRRELRKGRVGENFPMPGGDCPRQDIFLFSKHVTQVMSGFWGRHGSSHSCPGPNSAASAAAAPNSIILGLDPSGTPLHGRRHSC